MVDLVIDTDESCLIGRIANVDTDRAIIISESSEIIQELTVFDLVAIEGNTPSEFLVGIIEKVKRSIGVPHFIEEADDSEEDTEDNENDDLQSYSIDHDILQVALIGTFWEIRGDKRKVFKRGAQYFPKVEKKSFLIKKESLEKLMSAVDNDTPEEIKLILGNYGNTNSRAVANGDKLFQRHAALLGSTGSGKSWTVASLLEQAAKLKYNNIVLFDLHGEYKTLSDPYNQSSNPSIADYFKIASPANLDDHNCIFVPHWLLNKEEMLSLLLDRSDSNAPNQSARFIHHVRELKNEYIEKHGIEQLSGCLTVDAPIPYSIEDLVERLISDDEGTKAGAGTKEIKGDWNGKLTRFISRLKTKIDDKRNCFLFSSKPEHDQYDWLANYACNILKSDSTTHGIKIIDFSEVPSDIMPIVIGVLTRFLYNVQFWREDSERTPIAFVCDEAHIYLPTTDTSDAETKISLSIFEKIAKEGRKYGVSLLVVSQRPSDVSRTILSQCNNIISLRLSNYRDQQVVSRLMPDSLSSLTSILPILDTGEAIVLGDSVLLPSRIKLNEPKLKPDSATRAFWNEWGTIEAKEDSITNAVESLRRQSRKR
ncbi:ATP-binding protein [Pantoea cypripedii]|uniref:ATPase n=1 Tax=Pantoea cypripedii TaxID=55209 RepID=A0A6B9GBQ3_PANCY|nr:ATP-binding protein [Pantoea cypripedii]QGY30235.1 ATPase [Pantoea cypripedii]